MRAASSEAGDINRIRTTATSTLHDTLRYISHEPVHRSYQHDDLTFGLLYAFFERFILAGRHRRRPPHRSRR